MPNAAHAAAYVAVRHYLRAAIVAETQGAGLINQDMRRSPDYFFGRSAKLRLDGRLGLDLLLLRVKPPQAMAKPPSPVMNPLYGACAEWDHYEQIGIVPVADAYRTLSQTGCASRQ